MAFFIEARLEAFKLAFVKEQIDAFAPTERFNVRLCRGAFKTYQFLNQKCLHPICLFWGKKLAFCRQPGWCRNQCHLFQPERVSQKYLLPQNINPDDIAVTDHD